MEYRYYARVPRGFIRARPAGVVRRDVKGATLDEAFTRNLRWEWTDALRRSEYYGDEKDDFVQITEAEAEEFVRRITAKLSGHE